MITALGLDISLASTGVARPDGRLFTIDTRKASTGRRLHEIARRITPHIARDPKPEVIMVERIAGPNAGTNIKLAHVHGVVLLRLFEMGLNAPVIYVASNQLTKYATGIGKKDKPLMVETAQARAAGRKGFDMPRNDDEADAFWLREIALDHTEVMLAILEGSASSLDQDRLALHRQLFSEVT